MLKLKKYNNQELGIYDETNKKFVPLRGENLAKSVAYLRSDIREYFMELGRKDLIVAAKIILKSDAEKETDRLAEIERQKQEKKDNSSLSE